MADITFSTFYDAYPRKVSRRAADKAWSAATRRTTAEAIMMGLATQTAAGMFDKDKQFIPHPATWLNGDRWDDEIVMPLVRQSFRNGAMEALARQAEAMWPDQPAIEGPDHGAR